MENAIFAVSLHCWLDDAIGGGRHILKDVSGRILLPVNSRKIYEKKKKRSKRPPCMYVIGIPAFGMFCEFI